MPCKRLPLETFRLPSRCKRKQCLPNAQHYMLDLNIKRSDVLRDRAPIDQDLAVILKRKFVSACLPSKHIDIEVRQSQFIHLGPETASNYRTTQIAVPSCTKDGQPNRSIQPSIVLVRCKVITSFSFLKIEFSIQVLLSLVFGHSITKR